ncbi:MAG: EF-hand domain-containing protein [Alphaproteobacteria bacterium]|jgi:Ca2+-binding EF-hand superfamily protein|nr:EF-hand domain-containing protein [Alphaproteobacteria bacterium]
MKTKTVMTLLIAALASTALVVPMAEARGPQGGPVSFETFDADGDGKVTQAEFDAFRATRFAERDTDGDGFLSAEEIAASMQREMGPRAERMIERMDANGDGLIAPDELGPRGDRGNMIARLDTDGDGAVSEEEFEAMKMRRADMRKERGPRGGPRNQ